jgi:hypothetical protein
MNQTLLRFFGGIGMLCIAATTNAQLPGNPPQPTIAVFKNAPVKTQKKLSPELYRLVSASQPGNVEMLARRGPGNITNGLGNLLQIVDGKVLIDITVSGKIGKKST